MNTIKKTLKVNKRMLRQIPTYELLKFAQNLSEVQHLVIEELEHKVFKK